MLKRSRIEKPADAVNRVPTKVGVGTRFTASVIPFVFLLMSTLACYSDSPLWYGRDLTPTPQPATPIPPIAAGQSRFQAGDIGWVPVAARESGFQLNLTIYPEPLDPLYNKARQSCSQNTPLEILYAGQAADETIYYLIDCLGAVGWTTEDQLLGPLDIQIGDRALTTEAGINEAGQFKIDLSDPPYDPNAPFRQQADCKVNDTVDVIAISGFSTGELYYKIRCANPINPVAPNLGWTTRETLFGPVRLRNREIAIVPDDITLATEPEGSESSGSCQRGELVTITDQPVQRIDDRLYYEVECADGKGWINQEALVGPVPYPVESLVLLTMPRRAPDAPLAATTASLTPTEEPFAATTETPESAVVEGVGLSADPAPLVAGNQVGLCPDAALATVHNYAGVEDTLYAQVTCNDVTGWLEAERLYGPALYQVGETVQLGEKAVLGFGERGIFLSVEIFDIQGGSGDTKVCAYDFNTQEPIEATLSDVGYDRDSLGNIVGIFYKAQCAAEDGSLIEGWINQKRIGA